MPYVVDGPEGTGMDERQRRQVRPGERHGLGRPRICAGHHPPLRPHGLDRPLRRRQEGHPPPDRGRPAPEGPGPRRRAGRGAVRRAGLERPAERSRGRDRDAAHLQRLAPRFLQQRARPAGRPGQHPELRHGRVGRRGDALRQARRARPRHRQPARHDAALGPVLGAAVEVRPRDRHSAALPHDRRPLARRHQVPAAKCSAASSPRTSPASRCT